VTTFRFPLVDFLGRIKSYFLVEGENISGAPTTTVRTPGHFIFVVDCSGSMWGQMDALRALVVKLLTLEEYRDADVLVSILSFSSAGDLRTHASRVKIGDFMAPGSKALADVQSLSCRGLTCISQGLKAVPGLLAKGEVTAVTLLSDGYANDRSPGDEKRVIDSMVIELAKNPDVFINTISLGSWADFKLLSYIANACSGTCFQAPTAKEVYDNLHATTSLIAGQVSPALTVEMNGADYAVCMSRSGGKIIGGSENLLIRGLRPEDDTTVYRFKQVEEATYNASSAPIADANERGIFAFARAQLAEGYVNKAKYALCSTRNESLLLVHARALVSTEIAAMAADLENAALRGAAGTKTTTAYGLPNAGTLSVLGVLSILGDYASDIEVDLAALRSGYQKRGVKRIAGVRQDDGTVVTPWVKTAYRDTGSLVRVSSFDLNRNNATVNMLLHRKVDLVKADDGTVISEIEGVKLDLTSFNNYTIVGDGALNVNQLSIRIGNKRLFRDLVKAGVLSDGEFNPKATYDIVLAGRPLIAYDASFAPDMLDGVISRLTKLKVLASILSASMKGGASETYTPEQVAERKRHYVTTGGNFSPPTTNEYADIEKALSEGIIDTRISYKVDIGSPDLLNLSELYSANEYLARRFTVSVGGVEEKKPKFDMRWDGPTYGIKPVSARTTLNTVDDIMYPIFLDFLGLTQNGTVERILTDAGIEPRTVTAFVAAVQGAGSKDDQIEAFSDMRKAVDGVIEDIFRDAVAPMVFYIGATGLVPDEFNARALTAEQVKEKYPDLSIPKAALDGTFYVVGQDPTILSVFMKAEYFSTGKVPSTVEEAA